MQAQTLCACVRVCVVEPAVCHLADRDHQPHMNICIGHIRPQKMWKPQKKSQVGTSGPPTMCLTSWKLNEWKGGKIPHHGHRWFLCPDCVHVRCREPQNIPNLLTVTRFNSYYFTVTSKESNQQKKKKYSTFLYPHHQIHS